ncbi:MAG: hypothetical protein ACHQNT_13410 [Bacteroidia bacterium]
MDRNKTVKNKLKLPYCGAIEAPLAPYKPKINAELWNSTDNQSEIHYFIKGTDTYIFGYNPRYFTEQEVNNILSKNFKIGKLRKRKSS